MSANLGHLAGLVGIPPVEVGDFLQTGESVDGLVNVVTLQLQGQVVHLWGTPGFVIDEGIGRLMGGAGMPESVDMGDQVVVVSEEYALGVVEHVVHLTRDRLRASGVDEVVFDSPGVSVDPSHRVRPVETGPVGQVGPFCRNGGQVVTPQLHNIQIYSTPLIFTYS